MIQTLVAVLVGVVGVCIAVVGGVLLQIAYGEWRTARRVGELAPTNHDGSDRTLRQLVAAAIVLATGLVLIAIAVIVELT